MRANRKLVFPASVLVATAALALAGCASGAAPAASTTPGPTVTVTATVTATPEPVAQSPDDPLTALEAWSICYARAVGDGGLPTDDWVPPTFQPETVKAEGDGFSMLLGFAPKGEGWGAGYDCSVSGTLGAPVITNFNGPYDFG